MNADELNNQQENALSILRAKIAERKKEVEADLEVPFPSKKREYLQLPELTILGSSEFSIERYQQLTERVDYAYNNFALYMVELHENLNSQYAQEGFETALKVLCKEMTLLLEEGTKPRF